MSCQGFPCAQGKRVEPIRKPIYVWFCNDILTLSNELVFTHQMHTVKPVQSNHPLVQIEAVFVGRCFLFAGFIYMPRKRWLETKKKKKKITTIKSNGQYVKELMWVYFSAWALLGFLPNFFRWMSRKKDDCGQADGHSMQGKPTDGAWKTWSLVAQGRWSLFVEQLLCETVRARKSGRWKQVVAKARFYCTYTHLRMIKYNARTKLKRHQLWTDKCSGSKMMWTYEAVLVWQVTYDRVNACWQCVACVYRQGEVHDKQFFLLIRCRF